MKQKHWKVSVFDKISETIRDDTFYTTDTEAYLVFELIDKDFTPDSATVTVYNIYGKATINASVEVANGVVSYEIPEEAIGHPGGWRTQVIYTKDNEDYTTKIIEFDVGGHLLDNKKPAIVDIENWNSFIEHAGELIDDWEQLEEIRQANEQQRELAESARQTEFEANEISRQTNELVREEAENNRQSTFETNESTRQANELIREEAEGNRQSTFEENEVGRQSEFEENELARESAESVRVANEAERITKDSERDSKIEALERVVTKPIHTLKVENEVFSSDEVSVSEGVITINNHNLKVGDKVAFVATAASYQNSEPFDGPMYLNTVYYVVNPSTDSFQISTTKNGEPIVFNMDAKGFLWQFEKVNVRDLEVSGLDGTKYRAVFTGAHEGRNLSRRLQSVYTNPGNNGARYSTKDLQHTLTATNINPVHGVIDIYSEMFFKIINRKILIDVDSSFTIIGETAGNHTEETYRNRILTKTTNPVVGFQDSINLIGVGGRYLFDGSTLEVYEA